jgi:hypothetical protein
MSDLPKHVEIHEEGPREGFQIEPGPISTADKIRVIEQLAETGLHHIQACSFVNPRVVPGWSDADTVIAELKAKPGVHYTALWFNENGLNRALAFRDKLTITGSISLTASEAFTRKNLNRNHAENLAAMRKMTASHLAAGLPVNRIGVVRLQLRGRYRAGAGHQYAGRWIGDRRRGGHQDHRFLAGGYHGVGRATPDRTCAGRSTKPLAGYSAASASA